MYQEKQKPGSDYGAIVFFDNNHHIVSVNERFIEVFGYDFKVAGEVVSIVRHIFKDELKRLSGSQFDPGLVPIFEKLIEAQNDITRY
jgi:PAS domain-containing protein